MDSVWRLEGVTLRRGGNRILDDVTLRAEAGEHWVVMGPNGAGKTSLVRTIAGRLYPSSGAAWVLGSRLGRVNLAELRTRIGFASAHVRIPPGEPVASAVLAAAWGRQAAAREGYEDADRARASDLLEVFGIRGLAGRRFATLSQGEQQRVQLVRALMPDPEILILDEPGAGLDLGARELLVEALTELTGDPHAPQLVLVTHQIEEIAPGFTHVALLRAGRVVAQGPIERTLTGVHLSEAFGLPLVVRHEGGRWSATMVRRERVGSHAHSAT